MMEFFLGSFNNFLQHFERLAVFRKWGILNLSDDSLVYRIISSLNGLSSLKTLSLARNYFERWNKWKLLSIISNLFLILDYVHFFIISYKYVRGLTIPMRQ
jgi:Leucine-rich repeat (LRR) protein